MPARCGTLDVPENRSDPNGRRIGIRVAVVPALSARPADDPLVILVGGPGQAGVRDGAPVARALRSVRRKRDIVLVDQRGTGESNGLDCEPAHDPDTLIPPDPFDANNLRECLDRLDADVRHYGTDAAMDDLDEVRDALGYQQINLWGASYGTRAALVYLRRHPQRVRTVVLDGVAPPGMRLPLYFGRDGQRAMDLLLVHCNADEACSDRYPELGERLNTLLEQLAESPFEGEVRHPRTGRQAPFRMDRDDVAGGLRQLLYAPPLAALLPGTISAAADGDFTPFIAQLGMLAPGKRPSMYLGMTLSVACAEDVAAFDDAEAEELSRGTFLGDSVVRAFRRGCEVWPVREVGESYHQPVLSDAPVLILSGMLDPVTPPSWGEEAGRHLTGARHVVVPGAGHGVTMVGCIPGLIAKFLDAGSARELDTACAEQIHRPPFFLDFAGPTP